MTGPQVLSLGGGHQSTALLLLSVHGGLEPLEAAIFADTGGEPAEVYRHMDFLERAVGERVPIRRVQAGNLRADIEAVAVGDRPRLSNPPVFVKNAGGGREGRAIRACTRDYKIRPIERELRALGFGPSRPVTQWLGISTDEVERMSRPKDAPEWITYRWPLIELGMSRAGCVGWLVENGYPRPPKSACTFCPFSSDARWRQMRDSDPDSWQDAIEVDGMIRSLPGLRGEGYLHRQLVPLPMVDLRTPEDRGQLALELDDGAADECGGSCFS